MEKVIEYIMAVTKLLVRLGFAYGVCLLFTMEFNPLMWSNLTKFILIVIVLVLLSND